MAKRTIIISLIAFILGVAFLMWLKGGKKQNGLPPLSAKEADAGIESNETKSSVDLAERKRALLNAGNVPIVFWGKVIDESGNGISGVIVKYRIQRAGDLKANGAIVEDGFQAALTSNADGSFSITNASGTTLSMLEFAKDGYELSANQNKVFGYNGTPVLHRPDQQSPQVFMMRSTKAEIDVSSIRRQMRLPWDGKAIRIDLDSGSPSQSGKLVLTATRTASTGQFGWSVTLSIDGGELREAELGTAFMAPENGYLPVWRCEYAPDAKPWRFGHDANVYYRINGKFGRLKLQIYADAGPNDVSIYLERFTNNSGGRYTDKR